MKTGNFIITAGEKMNFIAEEIEIHATENINNISARQIIKNGGQNGRNFGYYKYKTFENLNVKIKDKITFSIYHTWVSTQPNTEHIGNDKINVSERRLITAIENGEIVNQERFVTDYYAHVNDEGEFDGFAYSTWYYHDKTNFKTILKQDQTSTIIMKQVVEQYAKGVAKYKKEHRNGSPVQAQAVQNRKNNKGKKIALNSSSIIGSILSQVSHPFVKIVGGILRGSSTVANALIIDNEHADEVAIKILIEVLNPEFAK